MGQSESSPASSYLNDDNTLTNIEDITRIFQDSDTSTDLSLTLSSITDLNLNGENTNVNSNENGEGTLSQQEPLKGGVDYKEMFEVRLKEAAKVLGGLESQADVNNNINIGNLTRLL